ncbi:hypothetical protein ACFPPA_05120 [Rhodanobacter ginsengisoli]|uniref:EF-hand domain-containing protein n=1 Tax=Rhodanobacter ginsengisoli TaxID=418646 RepID=A0ABW0QK23_9GAMM
MKSRKPLLTVVTASALLFAGSLLAQDTPATSPPAEPAAATSAAAPATATPTATATLNTPSGELVVHSVMPPPPEAGPAPDFKQLSGGGKYITEDQAAAYPLLANDFLYADHNRDGRISKSEYEHWLSNK